MPKKITIVSAAALVMLIGVIALAVKLSGKAATEPLSKVSVYDREAGVIYTPDYEDFLAGCVEGMLINNVEFEPEALKAAAIAENSRIRYFLNAKKGFENLGADLSVNEYLPYTAEPPSAEVKEAARYAVNLSLTYDGEPFNVPICKISSGITDECPPYSPSIKLPCDENAPGYSSSAEYTPEEVRAALNGGNLSYNCAEWLSDPVYNDNGTLLYIAFDGENISGETLRGALNLRSTAVTAEFSEDRFVFRCKGRGNNRGMSIYAANYLAAHGKTAEEILSVFYPDAAIS